jgi:hypothetical protein
MINDDSKDKKIPYIFDEKRGISIAHKYVYVIPVCIQLIYVLLFHRYLSDITSTIDKTCLFSKSYINLLMLSRNSVIENYNKIVSHFKPLRFCNN